LNVIFDLDGTLTDPKEGIIGSVCYALERMGVEPPDAASLEWIIGPPLQASLGRILKTDDLVRSAECLSHYRERFSDVGLFENKVYPGVPEMLDELKSAGARLFVATSKPTVYSLRILDHFNLSSYFEAIYGSELDGTRTDKGELLSHLVQREGLDAGETTMGGDREHDIIGAKKNALATIGVLYGYGSLGELQSAGADRIAATPRAVAEAFSKRTRSA
jgi:phosphoglycolate phosphatase